MTYPNTASSSEADERFYVTLDDGRVVMLTLDELDGAFQTERIKDTTLVCRVGDTRWVSLAELADLDDEPEALSAPQPPPVPAALPVRAQAVPSVAPPAPNSMAPVVHDLSLAAADDDDLEMLSLRPKRRSRFVVAGAGAVLLGSAAAFLLGSAGTESGHAAQALPAPPSPAVTESPVPPSTAPAATATTPPPAPKPDETSASDDRFSEEMKRALLAADAERQAPKTKARAVAPKARKKAKSKRSKNDSYDPLNGDL